MANRNGSNTAIQTTAGSNVSRYTNSFWERHGEQAFSAETVKLEDNIGTPFIIFGAEIVDIPETGKYGKGQMAILTAQDLTGEYLRLRSGGQLVMSFARAVIQDIQSLGANFEPFMVKFNKTSLGAGEMIQPVPVDESDIPF